MGHLGCICSQELWLQSHRCYPRQESDRFRQRENRKECERIAPGVHLLVSYPLLSKGGDPNRAKIVCTDARYIPGGRGAYTKIVSLEMAEVCIGFPWNRRPSNLLFSMLESVGTSHFCAKSTTSWTTTVSFCFKSPVFVLLGNTRI